MPLVRTRFTRATSARWAEVNPILAEGEPGWDLTVRRLKVGNGLLRWSELGWATSDLTAMTALATTVEALDDEVGDIQADISAVNAAITTERAQRIADDNDIVADLETEEAQRIAADGSLGDDLDTERLQRIAADNALSVTAGDLTTSIAAEVTSRMLADSGVLAQAKTYADGKVVDLTALIALAEESDQIADLVAAVQELSTRPADVTQAELDAETTARALAVSGALTAAGLDATAKANAAAAASTPASHLTDYANPHHTSKADVGLGSVLNLSPAELAARSEFTGTFVGLDSTGHIPAAIQRQAVQQMTRWRVSDVVAENMPRPLGAANGGAMVSQNARAAGLTLLKGIPIAGFRMSSAQTAGASLTHIWYAMTDINCNRLKTTVDDTSGTWAAGTYKSLLFTGGSYTPSADMDVYVVLVVVGTGAMPTILGAAASQTNETFRTPAVAWGTGVLGTLQGPDTCPATFTPNNSPTSIPRVEAIAA